MTGVTAFVPARSGSKRFPGKNIHPLMGKPLVLWTLEACALAECVTEVIFSTDSQEYRDIASKHFDALGIETPLSFDLRSNDEAGDQVKIFDYLHQSVDKIFGARDGDFLLALPTVPLRTSAHIDQAFAERQATQKPVFSAMAYGFPISFAFTVSDEAGWEPVFEGSPMKTGNTRSQDQKPAYHPNGAIYIRAIEDLRSGSLTTLYDYATPFVMSAENSVDIDNRSDFFVAEGILRAEND
ncbi:acylneuraminate cytidylyltransferase family protein [uncultured Roseibium sp.]|uniref:acylneuraminate cytidylyltransferase family protein n=1 Tax=uncultured Roseibium sp. TaxID=1936171 RepID=UPI00263A0E6A|nr:acylneuraminate cytidylyltransferase family protein [uncultured Roseibium sp.]